MFTVVKDTYEVLADKVAKLEIPSWVSKRMTSEKSFVLCNAAGFESVELTIEGSLIIKDVQYIGVSVATGAKKVHFESKDGKVYFLSSRYDSKKDESSFIYCLVDGFNGKYLDEIPQNVMEAYFKIFGFDN